MSLLVKNFNLPYITRERMRQVDSEMINGYGIASIVMMERAGLAVAYLVEEMIKYNRDKKIAIVCGKGNNGGDGFVCARELHIKGYRVKIILLSSKNDILSRKGDASINLNCALNLGIPTIEIEAENRLNILVQELVDADIIVDAIFGTGLSQQPYPFEADVIERINMAGKPVVAVDIPSGLDANEGKPLGCAVIATNTVTMGLPKTGFKNPEAKRFVGNLFIANIGVPKQILEKL